MPAIQDLRLGDSADRLDGTETIVGRGSGGPGLVVGSPRHGSATSARADHLWRPWRVHALARAESLALHDVWEVDAALPPVATLGQWADALRRERQSEAPHRVPLGTSSSAKRPRPWMGLAPIRVFTRSMVQSGDFERVRPEREIEGLDGGASPLGQAR
jgi:hypothetical protein